MNGTIATLIVSVILALFSGGVGTFKYTSDGVMPGPTEWLIGISSSITAIITAIMALIQKLKKPPQVWGTAPKGISRDEFRRRFTGTVGQASLVDDGSDPAGNILVTEGILDHLKDRTKPKPDKELSLISIIATFISSFGTDSMSQLMAVVKLFKSVGFPVYIDLKATLSWGKGQTYPLNYTHGVNPESSLASQVIAAERLRQQQQAQLNAPADALNPSN